MKTHGAEEEMREVVGQESGKRQQRVAFVLVDGLGDVGIPSLGFRSPVEAAITPNLGAIASGGVNGLMDPVEPGLACGSDTAHLSLKFHHPQMQLIEDSKSVGQD